MPCLGAMMLKDHLLINHLLPQSVAVCCCLFVVACLSSGVSICAAETQAAFQAFALKTKLGAAKTTFRAQSLGALAQPVSEEIQIADLLMKTSRDEKGALVVDYGAARPKTLKKTTVLKVAVSDPEKAGKTIKLQIEFARDADDQWTYANKTIVAISVPGLSGALALVDANANGVYNDVRADGLAWPGHQVLFPLPTAGESWVLPGIEIKDFQLGSLGQDARASLRPLASIAENGLAVLNGANAERVRLGLTPRPESAALTTAIAKHCHWMALNKQLSHPEKAGTPAYSEEGNASGKRSILSSGRAPNLVADGFVKTLYHRYDVIRADLLAFGVASESNYSGIDGRSDLLADAPAHWWPILCPMPEQVGVPLAFNLEMPDPIAGDKKAGFPITVVFDTNKTSLKSYSLKQVLKGKLGPAIECYTFDAKDSFVKFGNSVALIAKDPLLPATVYQVMIEAELAGKPWSKTWVFQTR